MNKKDYIEIKEAADILGVSTQTLRTWEKKGKFPVYKNSMSGWRYYKREDIEKFAETIYNRI